MEFDRSKITFIFLGILVLIAIGMVLKYAQSVILPLIIAWLLSFLIGPAINFMTRRKIPTTLAGFLILIFLFCNPGMGQSEEDVSPGFFTPSDTFNQKRFNYALGISATTYTGFSIGLYHAWYKQYPQGKFRLFNDGGEWNNLDK